MRVYHTLEKLNADTPPTLTSACGHLMVQTFINEARLERNGLMFYMQAHETKLQTTIKTILQKDA